MNTLFSQAGVGPRELRRIVARLASSLGLAHLALAEDAVQTAALRAVQRWPGDGVPANPSGWLYVVARRAALDALRATAPTVALVDDETQEEAQGLPHTAPAEGRFSAELDDDELALLFATCHPALPQATQVALALRTMAGLELADVAAALLSTEAAVAQRLARARRQLSGQTLQVPAGAELAPRRESVLTVLSLMFLAGQRAAADGHAGHTDTDITTSPYTTESSAERRRLASWEAIRLARAVAAHPACAHPDADALAATLLLHGARLTGRLDEHGDIIPLPGQPRDRWDGGMIRMGLVHLKAAQRAKRLSRWHLQAGLAAEHALAPSVEATDWAAVVCWYELLMQADPTDAPRLGHAIALVESGRPEEGHGRLRALLPTVPAALRAHTLAALSMACARLGQPDAALQHLHEAIAAAPREADARLLRRRLSALT